MFALLWEAIPVEALTRYHAATGDARFQALWELLVIAWALRTWRHLLEEQDLRVAVRSDSVAALSTALKLSSRCPAMNDLAMEMALDLAAAGIELDVVEHLPGHLNTQCDALSRLTAPEPAQFPPALAAVPRSRAPPLTWKADATPAATLADRSWLRDVAALGSAVPRKRQRKHL